MATFSLTTPKEPESEEQMKDRETSLLKQLTKWRCVSVQPSQMPLKVTLRPIIIQYYDEDEVGLTFCYTVKRYLEDIGNTYPNWRQLRWNVVLDPIDRSNASSFKKPSIASSMPS
ncbi:MAG: hypothetical protein FRX48_01566 [Lasallia pustulata]|uniref:Uncharacterized protein n=1 Tax=Lasallia pustulata TaxID=136370 RepID=A0A5M8Q1I2_9LECA|nr:MAG: hypothetical protein FRX48_01566 [Lasallia pustulata]